MVGEKLYKVLCVLPVQPTDTRPYGDGLQQIMEYNYHNIYNLICVAPEFTSMPWFANNNSIPDKQDESHFSETVMPLKQQTNIKQYPMLKISKTKQC